MAPFVAHGSGIDEIIAFLAVPVLFLLYHLGKRLLGRATPNPDLPAEPDEQRSDGSSV